MMMMMMMPEMKYKMVYFTIHKYNYFKDLIIELKIKQISTHCIILIAVTEKKSVTL